jgi:hypothetical protein
MKVVTLTVGVRYFLSPTFHRTLSGVNIAGASSDANLLLLKFKISRQPIF